MHGTQAFPGNTIVEVLVALAIIGAVLAGAHVASNRGAQINMQTQDRSQAVKIAEQQLELIPIATSESDFDADSPFCIGDEQEVHTGHAASSLPPLETAVLASGSDGFYPESCVFNERYYVFVGTLSKTDGGETYERFVVTVRWNRIGGGNDEVRFVAYTR